MKKNILLIITSVALWAVSPLALADGATLTGSLDYNTPTTQTIGAGVQNFEAARITLAATNGDVYLTGIRVGTDTAGGLQNFSSIYLYDARTGMLIGAYPTGSQTPELIQFSPIAIGLGQSKTFLLRASPSQSAAGTVRLGLVGFSYATTPAPTISNIPIYGNPLTLPGTTPTASPSPTALGSPAPSPSMTPIPSLIVQSRPTISASTRAQINLLRDGSLIRAKNGNEVWIIRRANSKIFKRWVMNLSLFQANNFAFNRVRVVDPALLDVIPTSYLIRKINDNKVYELTNVSEAGASRQWIRTGEDFIGLGYDFDSIYAVTERELDLYTSGPDIYRK